MYLEVRTIIKNTTGGEGRRPKPVRLPFHSRHGYTLTHPGQEVVIPGHIESMAVATSRRGKGRVNSNIILSAIANGDISLKHEVKIEGEWVALEPLVGEFEAEALPALADVIDECFPVELLDSIRELEPGSRDRVTEVLEALTDRVLAAHEALSVGEEPVLDTPRRRPKSVATEDPDLDVETAVVPEVDRPLPDPSPVPQAVPAHSTDVEEKLVVTGGPDEQPSPEPEENGIIGSDEPETDDQLIIGDEGEVL